MRMLQMATVALGLLSASSWAEDEVTQASKDGLDDKIVCKVDRQTGSAISTRVCKKRSTWKSERDAAKRFLDQERRLNFDNRNLPPKGGG